ncbi:MAG TPA: sigma-E factor regulatory protein RseB domain-containing protein [Terriglobales bacterium]|nr:sigma-E factor regulatory protein RseB domain-containing protein [Terriglobales bacterium]
MPRNPASEAAFRLWVWCLPVVFAFAAMARAQENLKNVLNQMDAAAKDFRTTQANFTWTEYNSVINDISDTQTGKIYFRRSGKEIQMAANIMQPDNRQVIFTGGKIQVVQPKTDTVDVYDAGAHREEFESFLVLGFGGGGHDMLKSFEVKYLGDEKIAGVDTAKLDLVPKAEKVRQSFPHIILWIDPRRGLSIQQQLFQTSGDYRLAKYSDFQINQRIPDTVFKPRTTARTKIVSH